MENFGSQGKHSNAISHFIYILNITWLALWGYENKTIDIRSVWYLILFYTDYLMIRLFGLGLWSLRMFGDDLWNITDLRRVLLINPIPN